MKKLLLGVAFLYCSIGSLTGQVVDLRFTSFKFNNNLSSIFIESIEQDQLGFMWFGSTNGLHRFDGNELKNYLTSDGLSYGISETHIYELYSDGSGWLWISLNSNLCYYDIQSDSVKVIANENHPNGLDDGYFVSCYGENRDGELFVSTTKSIYWFNRDSLLFKKVLKLEHGEISNFIIDEDQNLWISTLNGDGIIKYKIQTNTVEYIVVPTKSNVAQTITDLEICDGKLWIATDGSGVFSYDFHTEMFTNYPVDSEYALNILELYQDKEGRLWMVDFTGVKLYLKERDFFQGYYPEKDNEYSIMPYAKNIFQDKDFNYWTIHSPGGIDFCPKPKGINRFDSKINSPFHLTSDNVSTICEDQFGNLWIGNPFNGLDIFTWQLGKTVSYSYENDQPNCLGKGATQCVFRDSKQQMWIGSYWGGLQRYRPETNDFISYTHDPDNPNSLSFNDVRYIMEDKDENLWLCVHGKGIDKFNPVLNTFTNYSFEKNNLANDYTFQILLDSTDNIWVATAWGLSKLEPGSDTFKNYVFSDRDEHSLSANLVNTIYIDRLNRLWVGTTQGLNLYQPENDNFLRIINGLANKNVVSISSDNDNNIWLGTYYGISRYTPETGNIINLSMDDGLISNNFLPRSIYNNGINTLFFGSVDGINYFNPLEIRYNNLPPEVYVTNIKILNQEINSHNSDLLSNNVILTDQIKLSYSDKIIEIGFSALNYVGVQNNKYAYYLEGFENDWNEASSKRNATYTNLDPGKYVFRVKASNNEGVWNQTGSALTIIVKPPVWKTFWFRAIAILVLMLFLFVWIHFREKNLLAANELLEKKVQERTAEINLQKEELEKRQILLEESNHFKNKFVSILAHDLKGPITSLMQLISLFKQRFYAKEMEALPKIIDLSTDTANNTYALLEELLLWGKAQTNNVHLDFESFKLSDLVHQTVEILVNIFNQKNIKILINVPENMEVNADKNSVKTILRNLLSNAIKFSYPGSKIEIDVEKKENEIIVAVKDYGMGMQAEKLEELFNNNLKISNLGTSGEKGTGMGISLSIELAKLNNGRIWAKSELSVGSTFYLSLPLKERETI